VGFIVLAVLLAVIAVAWILVCAFGDSGDPVNPRPGAYAFLYGGAGVCLLGAVAVLFLIPGWLRQKPWIGGTITCCFGVSFFGVFVAMLGALVLGSS
jgi:hypothetical protein